MKFDIDEFERKYYIRDSRVLNISIEYEEYSEIENKPNEISIILKVIKNEEQKRSPVKLKLYFIKPKEVYFYEDFTAQSFLGYYRLLIQLDNTFYFSMDPFEDNKLIRHAEDNQFIVCEDIKVEEI